MTVEITHPVEDPVEEAIVGSLEDAELPSEPEVPEVEEVVTAVTAEPETAEVESPAAETETEEEGVTEEPEVTDPVEQVKVEEKAEEETPEVVTETEPEDEFEKKFGIPEKSESGRQNRIPYPRVRKIVDKAIADTKKEVEQSFAPRITEIEELTTKVQEFEESTTKTQKRLEEVDKFEKILSGEPDTFLHMLSNIPAYQEFFGAVKKAFTIASKVEEEKEPETVETAAPVDRPEPNHELSDGSKVYDMEGLDKLLAWQSNVTATQVEARLTKHYDKRLNEIQERYQPMADNYSEGVAADQRIKETLPRIQAQAAEARTWPQFKENEDEIIKFLDDNPKISLEGAYRQIVMPKITGDKGKIREELLKEIKRAPKSTATPVSGTRKVAPVKTGPRPIEEIIRERVATLKEGS